VTRIGPVERVRSRLADRLTANELVSIPDGYQRLGSVVIVKLPESLRPAFRAIGAAYREELGVVTVLRRHGPVIGDFRLPAVEVLAGGPTETEVTENGIVYRFDAARVLFAAGNRDERLRIAQEIRPGEEVADLFAGIGYFTLPIAVHGRAGRVFACEANPVSFAYLEKNARRNGVADRVVALLGPNETAALPEHAFDRVVLGFLPNALPWVPRAVRLVRPEGGTVHVHQILGTNEGIARAESEATSSAERAGGKVLSAKGREVKPYGPGRMHTVVDLRLASG
jgi:tRNA wybutosine-synthesizing protein 2